MRAANLSNCSGISKSGCCPSSHLPDLVNDNDLDNLRPWLSNGVLQRRSAASSGPTSSRSPPSRQLSKDLGTPRVKLPEVLCKTRPGANQSNGQHRSRSPVMDAIPLSARPPVRGRENQAFRRWQDCQIARCSPAHSPDSSISTVDFEGNESPGRRSLSSTTSSMGTRWVIPTQLLSTESSTPSNLLARRVGTGAAFPAEDLRVQTNLHQTSAETPAGDLASTEKLPSCFEVREQPEADDATQVADWNAASPALARRPTPPEETGARSSPTRSPAPPAQPRPPNASPAPCRWHRQCVKSSASSAAAAGSQTVELLRNFTQLDGRKIYDLYYWEQAIQEDGDGGKVVACRRKGSEAMEFDLIMKIKSKTKLRNEKYLSSYQKVLMRMLNLKAHRNIVSIDEVLEDEQFFYVVMKRAAGGDFFAGLLSEFKDGVIPVSVLKGLMTDILQALDHLHEGGMLHRDIKPDNLVWADEDGARRIVLIDFDHADPAYTDDGERQAMIFGTRRFNAPETWQGFCTRQSDLYSVGVVFYLLMTGKMPYGDELFEQACSLCEERSPGRHRQMQLMDDVYQSLRRTEIDWSCEPWRGQPASLNLCKQLLAFSRTNRPCSARAALDHPWFAECG
eukprot:TRINITY_DN108840_c0_g1_i1.p1 TRINITY_DN108840_c0_g1~~TRINITY_DN108840_c0_g1_i1.p1  ORF type:complete len:622 (+),score=101.12 TRINITY_DN108840_c0_g1_i1:54-1919(+)